MLVTHVIDIQDSSPLTSVTEHDERTGNFLENLDLIQVCSAPAVIHRSPIPLEMLSPGPVLPNTLTESELGELGDHPICLTLTRYHKKPAAAGGA